MAHLTALFIMVLSARRDYLLDEEILCSSVSLPWIKQAALLPLINTSPAGHRNRQGND